MHIKTLAEFIAEPTMLFEGGNIEIDGRAADRIDLKKVKRSEIVPAIQDSLDKMNSDFKKKSGFPLWSQKLFRSHEFVSGSALHFLRVKDIDDDTFTAVKSSVGDIDVQVDIAFKEAIRGWLDASKGKSFGDLKLIGYKNSTVSEQFLGLFESNKFGLAIQIDFELTPFTKDGKPIPWARFSFSSAWEDMQAGLKGAAHKIMLRAFQARKLKQVLIKPKTSRGKERVITSAENAFSARGLREKLRPVLDDKGKQVVERGMPVYQEVGTNESGYTQEFDVIFKAFFDVSPKGDDLKKLDSFIGLLDLIKKYIPKSDQLKIADGFVNTLWGTRAMDFSNDPKSDIKDKTVMVEYMAKELGINPSRWSKLKASYYS